MKNWILWGVIFVLFLSCMITESERVKLSDKLRYAEIEHNVLEQSFEHYKKNHKHIYHDGSATW